MYEKYKSFGVPKIVEEKWLQEICIDIKEKKSTGFKKFELIDRYVSKLEMNSSIRFLIDCINNSNDDTFNKLLIGELLIAKRNQIKYNNTITIDINEVAKCIKCLKDELLNNKITIDESYEKLYY